MPRVALLTPEHAPALTALFAACEVACHCRFHHFTGDKNEWLARCAFEPGVSRDEFVAALGAASGEAQGMIALDDAGAVVGWLKLAPPPLLPKVYEGRVYKSLVRGSELDRSRTLGVGCLLVAPWHRKTGVSLELVRGAVAWAREVGPGVVDALEAFPRRVEGPVADGEMWMGPARAFEALGFREVASMGPYPLLRLDLREAAS